MEKKDKPRICQVLGVEEGEVFRFLTEENEVVDYRIHRKKRQYLSHLNRMRWVDCNCEQELIFMIEHPDRFLRKPCFTEREIADMKTVVHILGGGKEFIRLVDGRLSYGLLQINCELLPSLRPGQSVSLSEITGGNT